MKKSIKFLLTILSVMLMLTLTACKESDKADTTTDKEIKVGVLVADVSGEEALGFKSYLQDYISKNYNVTFEYTAQLEDAAAEKSAIEDFASRGFDAVISMSSNDRSTQLQAAIDNEIYYVVGSGVLDSDVYDTYKNSEYFLGEVGPSNDTEYEAGYAMGQYYKDKGVTSIGLYGAFIPNPMHVYRAAGVLAGLGLEYDGLLDKDAVVGAIYAGNGIDATKISGDISVSYMSGYDPDTIYATLGTIIGGGIDAYLSVGMTTTFFAAQLNEAGIEYSDIDSFTSTNGEYMNTGKLGYLAGKYSSSIGPVYALIANAVNGNRIVDENGCAPSISQGYAVATNYDEFSQIAVNDAGENPIYSKEVLDTMIGADITYDTFKSIVESK